MASCVEGPVVINRGSIWKSSAMGVKFAVLLLFALTNVALAQVPAGERAALLDLYTSTNGAAWTNSAGWNGAAGTECSWHGITCGGSAGQNSVIFIELSSNNLSGTLPTSLGNLPNLQVFTVSHNQLTGNLPPLTGLVNLGIFFANDNLLSGTIPPLNSLPVLADFEVSNNLLTGGVPSLAGMTGLAKFIANGNQLTGSIPSLAGLTNLVDFEVSFNQLTGSIPPLAGSPNLYAFTAGNNNLTGTIPSLAGLASLAYFVVSTNQLTGSIPSISGLSNLISFAADYNQLTGTIPSLAGLSNVRYFRLAANQLTGPIPTLAGLTALVSFEVNQNQLTGSIPALAGLTALNWFAVSDNQLTGPIPALTGLAGLQYFYVHNNKLSGNVPSVPVPNALLPGYARLCPNALSRTPDPAWDAATQSFPWYTNCGPAFVASVVSRKVHGTAGTFDLPLSNLPTSPTTETRQGPAHTLVFTFNKPIIATTVAISEGIAASGAPTISGNDVIVPVSGAADAQYMTVSLTNVTSADSSTGGGGGIRVGLLAGDASLNRQVTVADVGITNSFILFAVGESNFHVDINADGRFTVADKGLVNANLLKKLPAP